MALPLPRLEAGQRVTIAGRTGSGKTTLAAWLLLRSPQHWLILNPKHTAAYAKLPDAKIIDRFDARTLLHALRAHRFVIFNADGDEATPAFLDSLIAWLYLSVRNVGLCVDELYTLHSANGRAGDGLVGWLTRGRERKQSFLGLTQRPAWLSRFLFSEADAIGTMNLRLAEDRKRLVEMTGALALAQPLQDKEWLWYNVASDSLRRFGPVPLPPPNPET